MMTTIRLILIVAIIILFAYFLNLTLTGSGY